jgi:hypothetical protein
MRQASSRQLRIEVSNLLECALTPIEQLACAIELLPQPLHFPLQIDLLLPVHRLAGLTAKLDGGHLRVS